jgi:hypothetical protein
LIYKGNPIKENSLLKENGIIHLSYGRREGVATGILDDEFGRGY